MIVKTGVVRISAEQVLITEFEFKDADPDEAAQEAIAWAHRRLDSHPLQNVL